MKTLLGTTPYELIFQQPSSYNHIKVLGSLYFAHNHHKGNDKFASRSLRRIFMDYSYGKKGQRLLDLDNHEFFESRDVTFYEEVSPFHEAKGTHIDPLPLGINHHATLDEELFEVARDGHEISLDLG